MKFVTGDTVELDLQEQADGSLLLRLPYDAVVLTPEDRAGLADAIRSRDTDAGRILPGEWVPKFVAGRWIRRAGEPDLDSPDGVDLIVRDEYELADFICMGVVVTKQEHTDRGIVARVRFPPRCSRHRFIPGTGEGIAVVCPKGEVSLEGGSDPWTVRLRGRRDNIDVSGVALADLAREIMKRGAFVVFEDPTDIGRVIELVAMPVLRKVLDRYDGAPVDQPPPVPTGGKAIWDLVVDDLNRTWGPSPLLSETINEDRERLRAALVADMRERDRIGRERYGTPLQAHNGRDALVDAYQEALDGTVYVRQRIEEDPEDRAASILYGDFLEMTYRLRGILLRRGK